MNKILKNVLITVGIIAFLVALYIFGTGFSTVSSIFIEEFSVASDGMSITIKTGNASSMGFVRKVKTKKSKDSINLEFISAFGGLNGMICAKDEFVIPIDEGTSIISVYKGEGKYIDALEKDNKGNWKRVERKFFENKKN